MSDANCQLRCYRARSWIRRASELRNSHVDGSFIFYWIALNALYGQAKYRWGQPERTPEERDLEGFLHLIREMDTKGRVSRELHQLRRAVNALLNDPFLNDWNWKRWDHDHVTRWSDRQRSSAISRDRGPELVRLFRRMYVLRKQLFHGCSTDGGRKNRVALDHAVTALEKLVDVFVDLVEARGGGEPLLQDPPYPPSSGASGWNPPRVASGRGA